jgi:hypothetical protein
MNKSLKFFVFGGSILATSLSFGQTGPSSPYYMAAGDTLWTATGLTSVSSPTVSGNEYNLAVLGDIRTTSQRNSTDGNQYTLGMTPTGTTYAGTWTGLFDGTTDGVNNYTVNWDNGDVMAYDRNWQGGSTLFNVGGAAAVILGITSDGAGGLWVSDWNGSMVSHYTMGGTLLGSFDAGFNNITALAMDYTTGTLWMGSQTHQGQFDEFATDGTHLQTVFYANMVNANTLGGEFNYRPVPEPASMAALGLGIVALLRRKRSKSAA